MKKYELEYGGQFLKDLKLAKRRGLNMKDLSDITDMLQEGKTLPEKCRDHILSCVFISYWNSFRFVQEMTFVRSFGRLCGQQPICIQYQEQFLTFLCR